MQRDGKNFAVPVLKIEFREGFGKKATPIAGRMERPVLIAIVISSVCRDAIVVPNWDFQNIFHPFSPSLFD